MSFLPTKIHEDKFNNQGTTQGPVTTFCISYSYSMACSGQIARSYSNDVAEHFLP